MGPPDKPLSEADIDRIYGLEPVIGVDTAEIDPASRPELVTVACPYCGERFDTSADASAGPCKYVEDCQVCCQPIEMEVRVDDEDRFQELIARRGDADPWST